MNTGAHLHWGAQALWDSLSPLLPKLSIEVVSRVDSTNTRLLERARALSGQPDAPVTRPGELDALRLPESLADRAPDRVPERTPHGRRAADVSASLLVAEEQTRGRGRLGRGWISHAGASLTFSLSMPLAPAQWGGLSLAVGLALAEALDPQPVGAALDDGVRPRIALKWPNDLWLWDGPAHGRKLGGVLIETVSVGERRMCVVGVGLNVRPQPAGAPTGTLASGYACLEELAAGASAPLALAQVARPLVQALQRFESQGFAPLLAAYARRDLLQGHRVSVALPDALHGVADGVDEQGALRLRLNDGGQAVQRIVSGEVSVRLAEAAP